MTESPEEKEALEKLDEETEEVSWAEFGKEADREVSTFWGGGLWRGLGFMFGRFRPFRRKKGDPVAEPLDDPDPSDDRSMRDVMHESQQEAAAHVDSEKS